MGNRVAMRAAFLKAVSDAVEEIATALEKEIAFARWSGAENVFHKDATFPVVAAGDPPEQLKRAIFEDTGENPPGSSVVTEFRYGVYVGTADLQTKDAATADAKAEDEADALLDALEAALVGKDIGEGNFIDLLYGPSGGEQLISADPDARGRLYVLIFTVKELT